MQGKAFVKRRKEYYNEKKTGIRGSNWACVLNGKGKERQNNHSFDSTFVGKYIFYTRIGGNYDGIAIKCFSNVCGSDYSNIFDR